MTGARPDTWMPFYWGDYLRDTGHLSPAEHGAYLLLIGHYWTTGQPLEDDPEYLRRIARMTAREWDSARRVLARFFQVGDGLWRHGRIDRELQEASKRFDQKSQAGRKGNEVRWRKASQEDRSAIAEGSQPDASRDPQSQSQKEELPPESRARTAVPKDFKPDAETEQFVALKCIQPLDLEHEIEGFVNHYRANGELRADWQAAFRKWLNKRGRFIPPNGHGQPRQATAPPSFARAAMEVLKRAEDGKT